MNNLSIEALATPGTFFVVHSFTWGTPDGTRPALRRFTFVRDVDELSPRIVGLLLSGEPRTAKLELDDGDGTEVYLVGELTGAKVTSYQVLGGTDHATEQFALETTEVVLTCGSTVQIVN